MDKERFCYHREKPVRVFETEQTMYSLIREVNKHNLNSDAIGFFNKNITYRELFKNVDRLADAYSKAGIKEGDTVAICTINMPIVQENLLALSKLGATSKWIDLRLKGKDLIKNINEHDCKIIVIYEGILSTIEEIIGETNLEKVLVASPKDYLNHVTRVIGKIKEQKTKQENINFPKDKRYIKYKKFLKTGSLYSDVQEVAYKKDRPSIVVQSSGSTGKAKSIVHTEYNFNAAMRREAYTDLPFSEGKVVYIAIPPFVIYGLCGSVYVSLVFGMKAQMTPYVSETTVFDDLGKYNAVTAAPLHYRYLYNKISDLKNEVNCEREKEHTNYKILRKKEKRLKHILKKLSKVDVFVSGGDGISVQELLQMQHLLGKPIINGYGNNEMTGGVVLSPVYAIKPNSVGVPMRGVLAAAFDTDTNKQLQTGEIGELCFSSDNLFVEYYNDIDETMKIKQKHSDGKYWVHTGDLGYIDDDGYVYICGRNKRLIKRAAFKIAPETIETIILNISEVNDCAVVGVPDKEEKEVPMAFVVLNEKEKQRSSEITEKIKQLCMMQLPDYEIPKYIKCIESIPYHNNKRAFKQLEKAGIEYVSKEMQ